MCTNKEAGGILTFLDFLEKQCGGHGNGFVMAKDNKIIKMNKGLKLSNEEIVKMLFALDPDWFVYHTRIASAGSIKDKNCHPFWNKKKDFALMMNGTESIASLARQLDKTDTELVFDMINKNVIDISDLTLMTANYMGFYEGKVFAVNNKMSDPLVYHTSEEDGIVIVSDVPAKIAQDFKEMDFGIWYEGEEIKEKPKKKAWSPRGEVIGHMYGRGWSTVDEGYELDLERGLLE